MYNLIKKICFIMMIVTLLPSCGQQVSQKKIVTVSGIVPYKSESQLILDSDLIVTGTVSEILDSKWSNEGFAKGEHISNILQTDIVVKVSEVISGSYKNADVVVRIDKGEDEKTIVLSEGYPDFKVGENVLLFLARDDSDVATDEDYYVLTGMKQGKYNVDKDKLNSQKNPDNNVVSYSNENGTFNVNELKSRINQETKENPDYKQERQLEQKRIEEQNKMLFGD